MRSSLFATKYVVFIDNMKEELSLIKLLKSQLHVSKKREAKRILFPKEIKGFYFVKEIFKKRIHRPYKFAVYKNKSGKKVIAKAWIGKQKNFDYYSLLNEKNVYKELNNIYKAKRVKIPDNYKKIYIPKLVDFIQDNNKLMLLIEMVNYQRIDRLSIKRRIEIYETLISYFNFIGKVLIKKKNISLTRRSIHSFIFLLPFITTKAMVRYPKLVPILAKSFTHFMLLSYKLFKERDLTFIHKSLQVSNILSDGKKINIVDFQLSLIGHPILELAQLIIFSRYDKRFIKEFYNSNLMKKILQNKRSLLTYEALSIYVSHTEFAFGDILHIEANKSFLNHILNLAQRTPGGLNV